jgi:hypothetical protein
MVVSFLLSGYFPWWLRDFGGFTSLASLDVGRISVGFLEGCLVKGGEFPLGVGETQAALSATVNALGAEGAAVDMVGVDKTFLLPVDNG